MVSSVDVRYLREISAFVMVRMHVMILYVELSTDTIDGSRGCCVHKNADDHRVQTLDLGVYVN